LAEYSASQADLQIEIANQYPDIHLGPGYAYNAGSAGDNQWDLGLTVTLPVLNQNQGPIAEAQAKRAQAAAHFLSIQAAAVSEIDSALAGYDTVNSAAKLRDLPIRTSTGAIVRVSQVADLDIAPAEVELNRDNLRQDDIVSAQLEGVDLGTAMREVQAKLNWLPPGSVEYAGMFQLQQESFRNLLAVLLTAILLVFTVLLIEFRSFYEPMAIVFGSVLALFGVVAALWITGVSLNIISYLGAIIGVGIVAKNGILVLDYFRQLRAQGLELVEALVRAGHRRLRPVLMTSLAAALGMLPLAYGVGTGAQMLQPLGVAVIGALVISVLLSLIATPVVYYLMIQLHWRLRNNPGPDAKE
jgi:multidrug efflux pump subunit AcrB